MSENTESLPAPLTPADCDLRDFPYMPLSIARLKRSRAWLACKRQPEFAFHMLNLWMRSWHETPAGSIEDDDDVLADAAMADPRLWDALRPFVLRGWVKCSDGRLYHPVVSELAIEAAAKKRKHSDGAKIAASARWAGNTSAKRTHQDADPDAMRTDSGRSPNAMPEDAKRREWNGREWNRREIAASSLGDSAARAREAAPEQRAQESETAAIISDFDAALVEAFGEHRRRAFPAATDHEFARQWLDLGVTRPWLAELFRSRMTASAKPGAVPPRSLSYFRHAVPEALAAAQTKAAMRKREPTKNEIAG